jgi:hypothetical protein
MSWKAEVIADSSGEWCGNGLRFATRLEAERYVSDLAWRWTAVRETRVVESAAAVNTGAGYDSQSPMALLKGIKPLGLAVILAIFAFWYIVDDINWHQHQGMVYGHLDK